MRHAKIQTVPLVLVAGVLLGACGASTASTAAPSAAPAASVIASAATGVMSRGQFHGVDGTATGEAQLVVKPGGAYTVALENFSIGSIEHTNLVLVSNADVTATADIDKTRLLDLGPLKATSGMQDFPIPANMASAVMSGYHTAVLWDTAMAHAIAAAPLS
jgi:Electron transfer DM13